MERLFQASHIIQLRGGSGCDDQKGSHQIFKEERGGGQSPHPPPQYNRIYFHFSNFLRMRVTSLGSRFPPLFRKPPPRSQESKRTTEKRSLNAMIEKTSSDREKKQDGGKSDRENYNWRQIGLPLNLKKLYDCWTGVHLQNEPPIALYKRGSVYSKLHITYSYLHEAWAWMRVKSTITRGRILREFARIKFN